MVYSGKINCDKVYCLHKLHTNITNVIERNFISKWGGILYISVMEKKINMIQWQNIRTYYRLNKSPWHT